MVVVCPFQLVLRDLRKQLLPVNLMSEGFSMSKIMVSLAVIILIAGMGLGYGSGYVIFQPQISQLQSDLSNLQSEVLTLTTNCNDLNATYIGLVADHEILNSAYNGLHIEYNTLNATYSELRTEYDNLEVSYEMLYKTHVTVQASYDLLVRTFDSSLHDKHVPSIAVLQDWLLEDKTDEMEYNYPNFVCTEFAVMLAIHARAEDYDMGVVWIQGYINGTLEAFNHVLNAIVTTEGLVYVEPQSDQVWWYDDHQAMTAGRVYHIWESVYIDVKKVEIILDY